MSWRDDEIDDLFRDAADQQYVEFDPDYFRVIERQLPIKRSRKSLIWWFSSSMFLSFFLVWTAYEGARDVNNVTAGIKKQIADNQPGAMVTTSNAAVRDGENEWVTDSKTIEERKQGMQTAVAISSKEKESLGFDPALSRDLGQLTILGSSSMNETSVGDQKDSETIGRLELNRCSTGNSIGELVPAESYGNRDRKLRWYVETGGSIAQGWAATNPSSVNGSLFFSGGVSASCGKWNVTAGVGLRAFKLGDLEIMERTKIYGFGYSTYANRYTFNSFLALELPIHLNYTLRRHTVGIGVAPSYGLCTGLTRTEWIDGVKTVERSGVSDVGMFSKFGMTASVGYSYFVKKNTQIGARAAIQLLQPLSSDRFVGNRVKMPVEGQVFIRRTFDWKK